MNETVAFLNGIIWSRGLIYLCLGVGLMAWLNIVAIVILQRPALLALKDYEAQKRAGRVPVFDPDALGIRHADLWRH